MKLISVFAIALALLVVIFGIVSATLLFDAASEFDKASSRLFSAGLDLTFLRSVAGDTVAEAYYQEIGEYGVANSYLADGYSNLTRGLGYFTLMFSFAVAGIIILLLLRLWQGRSIRTSLVAQQPASRPISSQPETGAP